MTPGQTPEEQLAARIGQGGVDAAKALGWTPPKAPEPVRLVTMEESGERWDRFIWTPCEGFQNSAWGQWAVINEEWRKRYNAADNWLVRAVLRRLLDKLNTRSTVWGLSAIRREWGLDK